MRNESSCLADVPIIGAVDEAGGASRFDFTALEADVREKVQAEIREIHARNADSVESRIAIGKRLITLRKLVGRFDFQSLVKSEYSWEKSTTTNHMNVARIFPDLDPVCCRNIHWIALVILAREGVGDSARREALRLARAGTIVNKKLAEALAEQADLDTGEVDYDRLLNQAGRALKRAAGLVGAIAAVRPELSPDQTEFADDLMALGRRLFGPLQRPPVAEPASAQTCGAGVSLAPVAELARVQVVPVAELTSAQTCGAGVSPAPVAELARVQVVPKPELGIVQTCGAGVSPAPVAELVRVQTHCENPNPGDFSDTQTTSPVAELVRVPANPENPNSSESSYNCTPIVPPTVQPVAMGKPATPSRRGFLAAVGSAFGALCVTPFRSATAATPIVSEPNPAASQVTSATITERGPFTVTTYRYDAQGRVVSVIESLDPPPKSS